MLFAPDKVWTAVIDNFYYNQSLLISASNSALYEEKLSGKTILKIMAGHVKTAGKEPTIELETSCYQSMMNNKRQMDLRVIRGILST